MLTVVLFRYSEYDSAIGWIDILKKALLLARPSYQDIKEDGKVFELHFDINISTVAIPFLVSFSQSLRDYNYCYISKFNLS